MQDVPLQRIPQYKTKCAPIRELLEQQLKLATAKDVLDHIQEINNAAGAQAGLVDWLHQVCIGNDLSPVKVTPPPKSLSVSMTLTPIDSTHLQQLQRIFEYLTSNLATRLAFDEQGKT